MRLSSMLPALCCSYLINRQGWDWQGLKSIRVEGHATVHMAKCCAAVATAILLKIYHSDELWATQLRRIVLSRHVIAALLHTFCVRWLLCGTGAEGRLQLLSLHCVLVLGTRLKMAECLSCAVSPASHHRMSLWNVIFSACCALGVLGLRSIA
jgi:hypothetical protein